MNPRHPAWWLLPIFGTLVGLVFRPSEGIRMPHPQNARVVKRLLVLPDGRALRFLRGPGQQVFLSETEVPVSWVRDVQDSPLSHEEARAFAVYLAELTGKPLRLPTAEEWRSAARAGVPNAEFPWGFGPATTPEGVQFSLDRAPPTPGKAFGFGFRDLAGGTWEWTEEGLVLGSAWSETNPETLRIDSHWVPPPSYRGADTGLRLAWD